MPRRAASALLLLGLLLAMAPRPGGSMGCGPTPPSTAAWTQLGGPAAGGCTTSMPAASCLSGICVALPSRPEFAVAWMEHHLAAVPSSAYIGHGPPPPQPPPPEA